MLPLAVLSAVRAVQWDALSKTGVVSGSEETTTVGELWLSRFATTEGIEGDDELFREGL